MSRLTRRAFLALAGSASGAMLLNHLAPGGSNPVFAAEAPCQPTASGRAIMAAPPDARAASLARPFGTASWGIDQDSLLTETRLRVASALQSQGAPRCFGAQLEDIAGRTAFLSPFEFLVVGYYREDWDTRDALLEAYRADPAGAIRKLSAIWPSPRSERLVSTKACFDLDANQILVNTGVVGPNQALNVVTHEFWHALTNVRMNSRPDGSLTRTTGFWSELRTPGNKVWRPVEEQVDGGVPTYLMNEAVAIEMEVASTGREHPAIQPNLAEALETLQDLFGVAGRSYVLRLYLESRCEELQTIAHQAVLAQR